MQDKVELAPMLPCPVPLDVWNSLWHIDPNSCPILARPVDPAAFNAHADRLYKNRATGGDSTSWHRVNTVNMVLQPEPSENCIDKPLMPVWRGKIQRWE